MTRTHLHLVSDPADDIEHLRLVEGLVADDPKRVLIRLTPSGDSMRSLYADAAEGLGRRLGYQIARSRVEAWLQIAAWLIADEIEDIFVFRAHQLQVDLCECLIDLANLSGARMWLLAQMDPLPEMMREVTALWPMESLSAKGFDEKWRQPACPPAPPQDVAVHFDVPEDEFYTFWDTAQEVLEPDAFAAVDRVFQDGLMRTRSWLRSAVSSDEESVAVHLRSLISEAGDRNVALIRLRGAQAALFDDWILVKASFDQLTDGLFFTNPPMGLSNDAASRLQLVTNASDAALATIALATPLELAQVHGLRFEDVAPDGSLVVSGDARYEIPSSGARFLRAHLLVRRFKGARPGDNLFGPLQDHDGSESSLTGIRSRLNTVSRKTGLAFPGQWMRRDAETSQQWIAHQGISVQRLAHPQKF
jgi:hypothetical protein